MKDFFVKFFISCCLSLFFFILRRKLIIGKFKFWDNCDELNNFFFGVSEFDLNSSGFVLISLGVFIIFGFIISLLVELFCKIEFEFLCVLLFFFLEFDFFGILLGEFFLIDLLLFLLLVKLIFCMIVIGGVFFFINFRDGNLDFFFSFVYLGDFELFFL